VLGFISKNPILGDKHYRIFGQFIWFATQRCKRYLGPINRVVSHSLLKRSTSLVDNHQCPVWLERDGKNGGYPTVRDRP